MASQTPKSVHKRFADSDSDSAETFHDLHAEPTATPGDVDAEDSDSDSDAPPEAVSASTALEASRSAAKRAAATRRHATETERAKRQQFDAARVKETKSRRKREEAKEKETEAEAEAAAAAAAAAEPADTTFPAFPIPDELPAEVIAAAEQERTANSRQRAERLATREAERLLKEERRQARKLKLKQYLRGGPRTKTDVRHPGSSNTVIRVLPKASAALPPKSTRREQIAREHYLKGPGAGGPRRGRAGKAESSVVGRRKPWKNSFVVK